MKKHTTKLIFLGIFFVFGMFLSLFFFTPSLVNATDGTSSVTTSVMEMVRDGSAIDADSGLVYYYVDYADPDGYIFRQKEGEDHYTQVFLAGGVPLTRKDLE